MGDVGPCARQAGPLERSVGFGLEGSACALKQIGPDVHGGIVDRGAVIEDADRESLLRAGDELRGDHLRLELRDDRRGRRSRVRRRGGATGCEQERDRQDGGLQRALARSM
jgi:hypothetical protein